MTKYVFVTGGVVSSLGKGIAAASLAADRKSTRLNSSHVKISYAVFCDEHLTVLERAHCAGIDVDVGVKLEQSDLQTARFKNRCEGRGGDPLAQG